jgi:hypothetical protein
MTDALIEARTQRRLQLRARGYLPLPLYGKAPPLKSWQQLTVISREMIELWGKAWPDARNTGCLTRYMPALDLDIMHEPAAVAVEDYTRERYEERGWFLVRIGKAPKRAIVFRTIEPFKKITVNLIAPNGSTGDKIEFMADGQQIVMDGIHPDTAQAYRWFGGVPWDIPHSDLPYIHDHEAHQLVDGVANVLADFGYQRARATAITSNGGTPRHGDAKPQGEDAWQQHIGNILTGANFHDPINKLASMIAAGMNSGSTVHLLSALVQLSQAPHDARWEARYRDIPRAVDSAFRKYFKR